MTVRWNLGIQQCRFQGGNDKRVFLLSCCAYGFPRETAGWTKMLDWMQQGFSYVLRFQRSAEDVFCMADQCKCEVRTE